MCANINCILNGSVIATVLYILRLWIGEKFGCGDCIDQSQTAAKGRSSSLGRQWGSCQFQNIMLFLHGAVHFEPQKKQKKLTVFWMCVVRHSCCHGRDCEECFLSECGLGTCVYLQSFMVSHLRRNQCCLPAFSVGQVNWDALTTELEKCRLQYVCFLRMDYLPIRTLHIIQTLHF